MLIQCPECTLQASDKALSCPHCGYPFVKTNQTARRPKKSNKRKRLPNGFGQISEIKGQNLRKPFRAMVTVGKDEYGRHITKPLKPESYFATYNDAYAALVEYNRCPYDLNPDITVKELYEKWTEEYFKTLAENSWRNITSAWSYCSEIYYMRAKDVRVRHIRGVMENGTVEYKGEIKHASAGVKGRIKSMFNIMFDYAMEHEIVTVNYARTFEISDDIIKEQESMKRPHIPYTQEEIDKLWANVDSIEWVDLILIQCYSGWRPQELGLIEMKNVDIENWFFRGGMKTEAGTDRLVPIHSRIRPFVLRHYQKAQELGSEYLFNCTDTKTHRSSLKLTYDKWQQRYNKVRDRLGLNPEHRAHDGRKHFVTKAKKYEVDEYAIKYMVGHNISDITEKVYTVREREWLQSEIEKIK